MSYPTESTLQSDSYASDSKLKKELLDEREATLASLELVRLADQELKEHLAASFIFALIYTNSLENADWCPPPNVHGYNGMIWQENDRWSCFVLVHYSTSVSKQVPQAVLWNRIRPLVTKPEGVAWEKQIAFQREWRRLLESPGRSTAVRYFRRGEAVLPRQKLNKEWKELPLLG